MPSEGPPSAHAMSAKVKTVPSSPGAIRSSAPGTRPVAPSITCSAPILAREQEPPPFIDLTPETGALLGVTRSGPPALPVPGATAPWVRPRAACRPPTRREEPRIPGARTDAHRAGSLRTTRPDSGIGIGFAVQGQEFRQRVDDKQRRPRTIRPVRRRSVDGAAVQQHQRPDPAGERHDPRRVGLLEAGLPGFGFRDGFPGPLPVVTLVEFRLARFRLGDVVPFPVDRCAGPSLMRNRLKFHVIAGSPAPGRPVRFSV